MNSFFKFHDPKEIDVKGYLRKIKYYELDRDTKVDNNQIITLTGNGFNISIDKEKLTQQEYTQIKTQLIIYKLKKVKKIFFSLYVFCLNI